ncbi:HPP family protein [Desulfogranum marinum]|jgi:CBS domain-containing protein|uniref:CBS domain-containing protein n=1 Tax=Desulfogranum marinum TaxID=453220 RepID=UPI0019629AB9|nr:CBS domain-containing protein [Desulfogranum marinum]MBM9514448.1 CBS domain-containing protein [Desulfogranum marinum]
MFAIYDVTGRSFRDSLEQLYRVNSVRSTLSSHRRKAEEEQQQQFASSVSQSAIRAYKKTLQLPKERTIYHANQVMQSPVITVRDNFLPEDCWEILWKNKISQVPVLSDKGLLAGMLAKEDLLKEMIVDGETIIRPADKPLSEIMSPKVITADPVSDIRRVAQVLNDYHFNSLPIVDNFDRIVGIVTRTDIIRAVAEHPTLSLWG